MIIPRGIQHLRLIPRHLPHVEQVREGVLLAHLAHVVRLAALGVEDHHGEDQLVVLDVDRSVESLGVRLQTRAHLHVKRRENECLVAARRDQLLHLLLLLFLLLLLEVSGRERCDTSRNLEIALGLLLELLLAVLLQLDCVDVLRVVLEHHVAALQRSVVVIQARQRPRLSIEHLLIARLWDDETKAEATSIARALSQSVMQVR